MTLGRKVKRPESAWSLYCLRPRLLPICWNVPSPNTRPQTDLEQGQAETPPSTYNLMSRNDAYQPCYPGPQKHPRHQLLLDGVLSTKAGVWGGPAWDLPFGWRLKQQREGMRMKAPGGNPLLKYRLLSHVSHLPKARAPGLTANHPAFQLQGQTPLRGGRHQTKSLILF